MRKNKLKTMFKAEKPIVNGWLQIPSAFSAEVMAHQGWDSCTIDLQHGMLTIIILFLFVSPEFAFLAGTIDYLAHWHIDFLKHRIISYYGVIRDGTVFWGIQAIAQCLHYCTYYLILVLLGLFYP